MRWKRFYNRVSMIEGVREGNAIIPQPWGQGTVYWFPVSW